MSHNYLLTYRFPDSEKYEGSALGFSEEQIEFSAVNHDEALKWVENFTSVGSVEVENGIALLTKPPEKRGEESKIEVPKRRPIRLIEIVKIWDSRQLGKCVP